MNEAEIAEVLKARREEIGYKQVALAMSLGIHQRTIQRVERITATQIIVGANRYRRTNGYEVGGGVWRSGGIAILTDALRAAVRRKKAMEALRALTPIVGKNTISTENIEAAVKLLTPSGGPTE